MSYSIPPSNDLIDDRKQIESFFTIMEEIIVDI